jgi:hypothetical protein
LAYRWLFQGEMKEGLAALNPRTELSTPIAAGGASIT